MPLAPFRIDATDEQLNDLANRLRCNRIPAQPGITWEDGTPPAYLTELVDHWQSSFDWRLQETALNEFDHVRGDLDGTTAHAIHQKGLGPAPFPILLAHGWPDGIWRFQKLIPLLIDPGVHGGDPADAFDVVVPSLPGYGYSSRAGVYDTAFRFGDFCHRLMSELGYDRYGAHGGDIGSSVCEMLARDHARHVVGIHLTDVPFSHSLNPPKNLTSAEKAYAAMLDAFIKEDGAYFQMQGTRPRTAAAGLNDSPAGLAAWIVEKLHNWSDCNGDIESRFDKDEILTNVMLYWLTGTIGSSFLTYRDFTKFGPVRIAKEIAKGFVGSDKVPTAFALFAGDIATPPRSWGERFFNVQRWTEFDRGGHFAAREEPELIAEDIRAFFRPLRTA